MKKRFYVYISDCIKDIAKELRVVLGIIRYRIATRNIELYNRYEVK